MIVGFSLGLIGGVVALVFFLWLTRRDDRPAEDDLGEAMRRFTIASREFQMTLSRTLVDAVIPALIEANRGSGSLRRTAKRDSVISTTTDDFRLVVREATEEEAAALAAERGMTLGQYFRAGGAPAMLDREPDER